MSDSLTNINLDNTLISVLGTFSKLVQDPTHIVALKNDGIHTKGYGGALGAIYKPVDKITDTEFAVFDSTTFISLIEFLDDNRTVTIQDPEIVMKDDTKEVRYIVCDMSLAPVLSETTIEAVTNSDDVIGKLVFDDGFLETASEALGKLAFDKAFIESDDDKAFTLKLFSSTTENSIVIDIDKGKAKTSGLKLELPHPDILKNLYEGTYTIVIKNVEINDNEFIIAELVNITLDEEVDGKLSYICIMDDVA